MNSLENFKTNFKKINAQNSKPNEIFSNLNPNLIDLQNLIYQNEFHNFLGPNIELKDPKDLDLTMYFIKEMNDINLKNMKN